MRNEDKYLFSKCDFEEIKKRTDCIMKKDSHSSGSYKVTSLYFDDHRDTCYYDAINGHDRRFKIRARIYNDSLELIKLEIKKKIYSKTEKLSCIITQNELKELVNGNCIENTKDNIVRAITNDYIKRYLLRPKIIVSYDREAYMSELGNTRVTFDKNIKSTCRFDMFGCENPIYDGCITNSYLLEVKYDSYLPSYIASIFNGKDAWLTSNSKYRICRDVIGR